MPRVLFFLGVTFMFFSLDAGAMEKDSVPSKSFMCKCINGDYLNSCVNKWVSITTHLEEELPTSEHGEMNVCGIDFSRCNDGIDTWVGELSNWMIRNVPFLTLICCEWYMNKNAFVDNNSLFSPQKLLAVSSCCVNGVSLWQVNNKMLALKKRREESKKDR